MQTTIKHMKIKMVQNIGKLNKKYKFVKTKNNYK